MTQAIPGSCLCGAVRFEIAGAFDAFFLCHCRRCRKDTGSGFAANLFSSSATLTWVSGEDRVRRFQVPGTRHSRSFCAACGSGLPDRQLEGALLAVPAGSLDAEIAIRPQARICHADRAEWVDGLETVPAMDGLPSGA